MEEGNNIKALEKKKGDKKKIKNSTKFTILAIVLIAIFCVSLTPVTLQNDTYYTIKIGEHILQYGIDMQDPFSWHENLAYTYPHWLYDVLTYLIYSFSGFKGIYVTTCILSAILGISIYLVNEKIAKNQVLSFFIAIGTMYLIKDYIAARAQLVTFILFILTIYFIESFLETKKKRYIIGLIIIPLLIANLHLAVFPFYFILYLPYIAEYIIAVFAEYTIYQKYRIRMMNFKIKQLSKKGNNEEKIEQIRKELKDLEEKNSKIKIKRSKELQNPYKIKIVKNDNVKLLILIMIIAFAMGLFTPLGTTPYTYLIKTLQGNTTQNINEHLPLTLACDSNIMCTLVIFLAVLIFTKAKIKLSDLFMLSGLCYLMFATKRQVTMFAIICGIILNKQLVDVFKYHFKLEALDKIRDKMVSIIGTIIIVVLVSSLSYYFIKGKLNNEFVDEKTYPVKACDYILNNIDLGTARIYNEYNYGSYLLFRGIPVFIDSRADLYAPEFSGKADDIFMDFIETSNIGRFYEDTFKKYNITHVINYKNSKMNMIITKTKDSNYKEIYSDDYFVIYERLNANKDNN